MNFNFFYILIIYLNMSVYDKLLKFKNENDNFSYTFIIYDISTEEFVNQLKKK